MLNATPDLADVVVISRRYRGPPDSANGGYACGLLARSVPGGARVRLHRPPPLEQALRITTSDGALALLCDDRLIADGGAAEPAAPVPAAVSFAEAVTATASFRWRDGHPFPGCFVCGPERGPGDGLCIHPGRVGGAAVVAAPWVPDASLCDATGHVPVEVVWAALDCPSWFGVLEFEPGTSLALLGQLTARVLRRPAAGERCVAVGWAAGRSGRKLYGGAALFTDEGTLLGSSEAVWIEPRQP